MARSVRNIHVMSHLRLICVAIDDIDDAAGAPYYALFLAMLIIFFAAVTRAL